jgi:hypothetical protein
VQVSHSEGPANHTGPESCVGICEDAGEALTGERIGQPLSRESLKISGADVVAFTEGNMDGRVSASARPTRRGRRPWHVLMLFAREPGDLGFGRRMDTAGPHREDEKS